ncbi:50S ribosomal protein L23 [Candidatus Saccharibacteria bacterium]|nr:50S ribosomal protein L23 [Candidatus Saccharibacteria bacterium]NCU40865.1 50S ribosomal protein L23 [Candidatus Saccharibacteria bacterium]
MIATPRMSEKAYNSAQSGTYIFNVPMSATKAEVSTSVEADFGVKVVDVRLVVAKGKSIRSSRGKRAQPAIVNRSDKKKAYVRLAEGEKLNLFNEDEAKQEKK